MISRTTRTALYALVWAIFATLTVTLLVLGAPEPLPAGIPDPGPVVVWGLPVFRVMGQLAGMACVGFLMVAVFLLPNGSSLEGLSIQAVRLAAGAAAVWFVSGFGFFVATVADIYGQPLWGVSFEQLWYFVLEFSNGRAAMIQLVLVAIVLVWARWSLNPAHVAVMFGLSVAAVAPIALTGHSASAGPHMLAVASLLVHMIAALLWVGGLMALVWVALRGSKRLEPAVQRYSALATWCFAFIGVSGLVNASARITQLDHVMSSYGLMLSLKLLAFVLLGLFGIMQRRRLNKRSAGFVRLAIFEVFFMITAVSLAVVLSRTPLPAGDEIYLSPAEVLLSGPMPSEPTFGRLMWGWEPNGFGLLVVGLGTVFYLYGVLKLRSRGDAWFFGRTLSWLFGMLLIGWATFGGLGNYSVVMFSYHMISHMILAMIAPIFLVLGAPMTLALRTLPGPRQPGELSPRKMLNDLLHSKLSRFYTHPVVAAILFIGSLYAVYFSDLFEYLMGSHLGHAAMEFHFLLSGFLFYYVVVGIDPSPRKLPPMMRLLVIMIALPFHAFFSVALMSSMVIVGEDYYSMLDRPYSTDLLVDQHFGASVSWAMGEIPMLIVVGAIFWQWFVSDQREAKRSDRSALRDEDAELEKYNAYLQALNKRDHP